MVLEAVHRANDEQVAILAKHRAVIAAGVEAFSPAVMAHAKDSTEFSAEVAECLQLIPTEPESHYDTNLTSLNWRSGRAFCITSDIGIPAGPERNRMVSALLRDCFTATVVRVFSSATATEQTHFEAMAFARSCIDRFIGEGPLPKGVTDRLQCTALGHPMKIVEPTVAAHAAVTPLTLQARLHTISMMEPGGCP